MLCIKLSTHTCRAKTPVSIHRSPNGTSITSSCAMAASLLENTQPRIIGPKVNTVPAITNSKKNLDLADKQIGEFMVSPDKVIMEVKANERVPYWLTEMIASYNFRLIRVSKYCQ